MINDSAHIVSKFNWETKMDDRSLATELQRRISSWSREPLNRELSRVFDKLCPKGQVWKVDHLEIDLGIIDFENLERDLNHRIGSELREQLIQLTLRTYYQNSGIEIIDQHDSELEIVAYYLEKGYYSWSYRAEYGSLSEMIVRLLRSQRADFIDLVRRIGRKEKVRKRLAWQVQEKQIQKVIRELEPNHADTITSLPDELEKLRSSTSLFQTEKVEFRKNVWFWILNFLLTERGTLFNKIAFTRSVLLQTANHHNIDYKELLKILNKAVEHLAQRVTVRLDFVTVIQALSEDDGVYHVVNEVDNEEYWTELSGYLKGEDRSESLDEYSLDELIEILHSTNRLRLTKLLSRMLNKETIKRLKSDVSTTTLKFLFSAYVITPSSWQLSEFDHLFRLLKAQDQSLSEQKFWMSSLHSAIELSENARTSDTWVVSWVQRFAKKSSIEERGLIRTLDQLASIQPHSESSRQIKELYLNQLRKKAGIPKSVQVRELLNSLIEVLASGKGGAEDLVNLANYLKRVLENDYVKGFEELISHPDRRKIATLLDQFVSNDLIYRLIIHGVGEDKTILKVQTEIWESFVNDFQSISCQHFGEEFINVLNRLYITNNGKLDFKLLEKVILLQVAKVNNQDWSNFETTLTDLIQRLGSVVSIDKGESKALITKIRAEQKKSFIDKWEIWIEDDLITKNGLVELIADLFDQLYHEEIKTSHTKSVRAILEKAFINIGWKSFTKILTDWTTLESSFSLRSLSTQEKQGVLFRLMIVAGAEIRKEELVELLVEYISHRNVKIQRVTILKQFSKKAYQEKIRVDNKETFILLKEAIKNRKTVKVNGEERVVTDLLTELLYNRPLDFVSVFRSIKRKSFREELVQNIGLNDFVFHLSTISSYRNYMQAILEWHQLITRIVPKVSEDKIEEEFTRLTVQLLDQNRSDVNLQNFIDVGLQEVIASTQLTGEQIVHEVKESGLKLSAELIRQLTLTEKSFIALADDVMDTNEFEVEPDSDIDIYKASRYLIRYGELPLWFKADSALSYAQKIEDFVQKSGNALLFELRRNSSLGIDKIKINKALQFNDLLDLMSRVSFEKSTLFYQLKQFNNALARLDSNSFLIGKIRKKMNQNLLRSWIVNDWTIFSPDQFWKELIWELSSKSGFREKELIETLSGIRLLLPPAFRLSLDGLIRSRQQEILFSHDEVCVDKETEELPEVIEPELEKDGLHVKNAGLVLLNNYIQMLFERAKLINEAEFVDKRSQHMAVYYLQFAGTANIEVDEGFLALNKVLCGLHPSEVIFPTEEISIADKDLIDGMLEAMASYWSDVGETSPMGFRGNWLVRDGVLIEHDDRWDLTVEKRPYDVLLNQAPFSFSIIKYPWMKKPLHVNWAY